MRLRQVRRKYRHTKSGLSDAYRLARFGTPPSRREWMEQPRGNRAGTFIGNRGIVSHPER